MEEKVLKALLKDPDFRDSMIFAYTCHYFQKREDGTPYISHPIRVYERLSKIFSDKDNYDLTILRSALLHDTVEDTGATLSAIGRKFGPEVAKIVRQLTIPKHLTYEQKAEYLSENMPKFSDEALYVKLADRFDNVSSLDRVAPAKKVRYINETAEILYYLVKSEKQFDNFHKFLLRGIYDKLDEYNPKYYSLKESENLIIPNNQNERTK